MIHESKTHSSTFGRDVSQPPEGGSRIIDAKRRDVERPLRGVRNNQKNTKKQKIF
jgi:hypothetical protein